MSEWMNESWGPHLSLDVDRDPEQQRAVKTQLQHVVPVMSSLHGLGRTHHSKVSDSRILNIFLQTQTPVVHRLSLRWIKLTTYCTPTCHMRLPSLYEYILALPPFTFQKERENSRGQLCDCCNAVSKVFTCSGYCLQHSLWSQNQGLCRGRKKRHLKRNLYQWVPVFFLQKLTSIKQASPATKAPR